VALDAWCAGAGCQFNGWVVRNWAGNVRFSTDTVHRPRSVGELCALVSAAPRLRCLGTGHSFSDVADTDGLLVSVADLPPRVEVDAARGTATVAAGLSWGDVAPVLHEAGFAMHTLGSLPHISVAGSVATGTHGSGDRAGCLAVAVRGLEVVTAAGDVVTVNERTPELAGRVVALGALGVVTAVTLALEPAYDVRQTAFAGLPWAAVNEHLDEVTAVGDSVSLMTAWDRDVVEGVWVKQRVPAAGTADGGTGAYADLVWAGARRMPGGSDVLTGAPAPNLTDQSGTPGPWYACLPHFRPEFTPSAGAELQSEYLVPREAAVEALRAVHALREQVVPVLLISEIRTVAADDLWLSPAFGRDSVAIHFTWKPDPAGVLPVVRRVERELAAFLARPHWGKIFTAGAGQLERLYPRLPDFRRLMAADDPAGVFRNAFLERTVGAGAPAR
jgi:xylitol oxidase